MSGMDAVAPARRFSLPSWLPYLWRRVLFPGTSPSSVEPWRLSSMFWLLFVPGVLLYPCLSFHLFEPDESRYAQIPREMLQRNEWVVPYLQGEPYLDKPPLFYWLVMGSYEIFGVNAAAARLVPALALHLTLLVTYFMGRRWIGERGAFYGSLALALAPAFLSIGRLLVLDGVLTLWTTLSVFAAFEATRGERIAMGWWLTSAVACGLGVLTKGPVAIVLLVVPLILHRCLSGGACRIGIRRWLLFAGVVALTAGPWYVALCMREPEFARYFLWEHNVLRFVAPFDHQRGMWFYVPILLFGLLPGTLLLIPLVRFLLSGDEAIARRRTPELGFLLLAGGWCLLFFTISGCKLPTYILPAFPSLALALGHYLANSRWRDSRAPAFTAGLAFSLLAVAHHVLLPWYAEYRSPVNRPDVLRQYCGDPKASIVCYPRDCNAVAFHLGRDDLRNYRSKEIEELRTLVRMQPRTVILCTHRHSLQGLRELLPPEVTIVHTEHFGLGKIPGVPDRLLPRVVKLLGETSLGLCDLAVVERK